MLKMLSRPLISGLFFALSILAGLLIGDSATGMLVYTAPALAIIAYLIAGLDVLYHALRNTLRGQIFDENFLMALATVGALALGEYLEAAAVMLFFQIGETFQLYAVGKSRRSIAELMDIRPDHANLYVDGEIRRVEPGDVKPGDTIVIRPGERVPLDGIVTTGFSSIDTSALTGESQPREVAPGDELLSGCINQSGVIEARVTKEFGDSTVNRILDLIENASSKKSVAESFITRFARYYTPIVVILAAIVAFIPPLILPDAALSTWVARALIFLVVSCPCALVISVPLSFFGGIGGASSRGILIKGSNYLDALAKTSTVVFDKTGTLTRGVFEVQQLYPEPGVTEQQLLHLAAHAEAFSTHPISVSLRSALGREPDTALIESVTEIAGHGVSATVGGVRVLAGNLRLMQSQGIDAGSESEGTMIYIAADGRFIGRISIADAPKHDAKDAISQLESLGITRTAMLTGDNDFAGQKTARELGITRAYTQLLPQHKIEKVEEMFAEKPHGTALVFVGDGINDAPVLARADVGIAMGALGSDAAIEAADIVIMDDKPSKVAAAIKIARKTVGIANQNIVFALVAKCAVLVLAVFGISTMWEAVFADVGVSVIAILNAMRALNTKGI